MYKDFISTKREYYQDDGIIARLTTTLVKEVFLKRLVN